MKHRVKVLVETEKRGLLGITRKVMETRAIEVDGKTYNKMKRDTANRSYSIEEMMLYDDLFYDD